MKLLGLFVAGLLSVGSMAKADVFQCNFTEPFIIISVDTEKNTATWSAPSETDSTVPLLGLAIGEDKVLGAVFNFSGIQYQLRLDFNRTGSDGMSEFIYPWEGRLLDYYQNSEGQKRDLFGGCFSENSKPVCPSGAACG